MGLCGEMCEAERREGMRSSKRRVNDRQKDCGKVDGIMMAGKK